MSTEVLFPGTVCSPGKIALPALPASQRANASTDFYDSLTFTQSIPSTRFVRSGSACWM